MNTSSDINRDTPLGHAVLHLAKAIHAFTPSLDKQAQMDANNVEAASMILHAQSALQAARASELMIEAANQIAEGFPLLAKVFEELRVNDERRTHIRHLNVMIAADLVAIKGFQLAGHFAELAQVAADLLRGIPIPDDPLFEEVTATLHEELDLLPRMTQQYAPAADSPSTSASMHTAPGSPEPTDTPLDNTPAFQADLRSLKHSLIKQGPPPRPAMFHIPDTFIPASPKNDNYGYRVHLATTLWTSLSPDLFAYEKKQIPIAQIGPSNRPIFFARVPEGPLLWAATKKTLASAIVNIDYDGRTDDEEEFMRT